MSQKTRMQYSVLNVLTGIGGYIINTLLGFICRMVFVRCLAAEYLGINGLFSNILSMLSLAELGIGSAIVYALYKPIAENDKDKIAALMQFYGHAYRIIGCVVAIFGVLMIPFLNFVIQEPPTIKENLYVIYLLYLFNTASTYFFSYRSSLLTAVQQNYLVIGISYLFTIVQSILQIIFLVLTKEYMTYLFIQTIGVFGYNLTISYIAKKKYPYIEKKEIVAVDQKEKKEIVKNIKALTIWKLSGLLVNNTDNIIITYFSGIISVGYTSNYTLFSSTLNSLLTQLFNGITASVGNYNATESKEKKIELFNKIHFANFWLFGWAALLIFIVSGDLVRIFYGEQYVLPMNIPFVIAMNFYMVGMQNAVWMFKNTMGLFQQGRYLLIITAVINLIASIVLGEHFGVLGILLATAISRALTNTWYDPYAVFKYGFGISPKYYYKQYIRFTLVLILSGGIEYLICQQMCLGLVTNIAVKCLVSTLITNFIFILFLKKKPEFLYFIELFKNILKRMDSDRR